MISTEHIRGRASYTDKVSGDSDSCGMWERGRVGLLGLYSSQGLKSVAYHSIVGVDQDNAKGCRWIEIDFHGVLEMPDAEGELAEREGYFRARIEGGRLEPLMRQIRVGRRTTICRGAAAESGKDAYVSAITIQAIEVETD
jgi:hypothetical protein